MDGARDSCLESWPVINDLHRAISSDLINTLVGHQVFIIELVIKVCHVVVVRLLSIRLDLSILSLPFGEVTVEDVHVRMAESLEHECSSRCKPALSVLVDDHSL